MNIVTAQAAPLSISGIRERLSVDSSIATLNRDLAALVGANCLTKTGQGRGIAYRVGPFYRIFAPVPPASYFERDPDARRAMTGFNGDLLSTLADIPLFTPAEANSSNPSGRNIRSISPAIPSPFVARRSSA